MEETTKMLVAKAREIAAGREKIFKFSLPDEEELQMFVLDERFIFVKVNKFGEQVLPKYSVATNKFSLQGVIDSCEVFLKESLRQPDRNAVVPTSVVPIWKQYGRRADRDD